MRILDRYILKSFLVNYLLALAVLVGMYVLLDLIVKFEDFTKAAAATGDPANATAWGVMSDMADFYSYKLLEIYQQVSGAIPLLAAGFTMVRMTRHQELTAMLASGVSLYRVAAPIIVVSMAFSVFTIVNQEFIISQPVVIEKLLRKPKEINQSATVPDPVNFVVDSDNGLISARQYDPGNGSRPPQLTGVFIVKRDAQGLPISHIAADTGTWQSPGEGEPEAWVLRGVIYGDDRADIPALQHVNIPKTPKARFSTGMTPAQLDLIFQKKAVDYLSSAQVRALAQYSPDVNKRLLYKIMHLRFTQPLMNIIMLLIGIPFLLTREPNRLVINMVYCTLVTGIVFIATFVIFQMGGSQLDPLLAAWLPVLLFGPVALVMLDMIHT